MTDIQQVTFILLPRAEGLLAGTIKFLDGFDRYDKEGLLKNLKEIHQLLKESKNSLMPAAFNQHKP